VLGVLGASAYDARPRQRRHFAHWLSLCQPECGVQSFDVFGQVRLGLAIQFEPSMPSNPQRNTAASLAN
jgi:hypothetical protein